MTIAIFCKDNDTGVNSKVEIDQNAKTITIGKNPNSDIVLNSKYVSNDHATIKIGINKELTLIDNNSKNGISLNNEIVKSEAVISFGNLISIAQFDLKITSSEKSVVKIPLASEITNNVVVDKESNLALFNLRKEIHDKLLKKLKINKRNDLDMDSEDTHELINYTLNSLLSEYKKNINNEEVEIIKKDILDFIFGYGPIEDLLNDNSISEIMVNSPDQIFIEKNGKVYLSKKKFFSKPEILQIIEKMLSPLGKSVNESNPISDARLTSGKAKGSRINVIVPPIAIKSPTITIRKFSENKLVPNDLIKFGSISTEMVSFLQYAVKYKKNIIISGGTGSGKTTLLNILSSFIPPDERIVTIEDAAELQLNQDHVVSLEARQANIEGKGAITIRELLKNSLRMRPDRIIIGECRGGETLDMLQAMNTGHDGSITTVHANNPRDVLSRLETMVLMSGLELPIIAIRSQIASAIEYIVQQSRFPDGTRKVTHITEITGMQNDIISTQDIFKFHQTSQSDEEITGEYTTDGIVPQFIHELRNNGIDIDLSIFRETK